MYLLYDEYASGGTFQPEWVRTGESVAANLCAMAAVRWLGARGYYLRHEGGNWSIWFSDAFGPCILVQQHQSADAALFAACRAVLISDGKLHQSPPPAK
jgi:hypothetical protein